MSDSTDCSSDLLRIPGLFRRWELQEVLEADRRYHIEDAGTHLDGTPLLALYANGAAPLCGIMPACCRDVADHPRQPNPPQVLPLGSTTEQFIRQRELADRWKVSPRTLERWRRTGRGPTYLKLGFRIVYSLRYVEAFEAEHLHVLQGEADHSPAAGEWP